MVLGAGRATKEETIDHSAGILLAVKTGDYVEQGQLLATLYTNKQAALSEAEDLLQKSIVLSRIKPQVQPLVYGRVEVE